MTPRVQGQHKKQVWRTIRGSLGGYAFIAPFMMLFITFTVIPFFWALGLSTVRGDLVDPIKPFVGLENYVSLFKDNITLIVFKNTFQYVLSVVPIVVLSSLVMAFLIGNRLVKFKAFFRGVVYFPLLASTAATAQIWSYLLAPRFGILSYLVTALGFPEIYWLSDPKIALYAILLVEWWRGIGFHVVLFLASMLGVPVELQEASRIDGANAWQVATRITIPLMRPVILFSVVMGTIWAFQLFETVFVMTNGGPVYSTATMVWYVYNYAFRYGQVGMASAMGVVLLAIIMPISFIQMRVLGRVD
jgi:sn-glycerol 3-phosphate transport system permease protein